MNPLSYYLHTYFIHNNLFNFNLIIRTKILNDVSTFCCLCVNALETFIYYDYSYGFFFIYFHYLHYNIIAHFMFLLHNGVILQQHVRRNWCWPQFWNTFCISINALIYVSVCVVLSLFFVFNEQIKSCQTIANRKKPYRKCNCIEWKMKTNQKKILNKKIEIRKLSTIYTNNYIYSVSQHKSSIAWQ